MPTVSFQILKGYCQKKSNSETKIEAHAVPRVGVLWPWYLPTTAGQRLQGLCEVQSGEEDGPVPAPFQRVKGFLTVMGVICVSF